MYRKNFKESDTDFILNDAIHMNNSLLMYTLGLCDNGKMENLYHYKIILIMIIISINNNRILCINNNREYYLVFYYPVYILMYPHVLCNVQ